MDDNNGREAWTPGPPPVGYIPKLSLNPRAGRGGRNRRGRGGGLGGGLGLGDPEAIVDAARQQDLIIQATDRDASGSRQSAVRKGYLKDPFAFAMTVAETLPRLPIINRGTYVRTTAIDHLVESFLKSNVDGPVQIISLGAGTDTRYFRLREKRLHYHLLYHEIDFPDISVEKFKAIKYNPSISGAGTPFHRMKQDDINPETQSWGYYTNQTVERPVKTEGYLFHPIDLRKMPEKIQGIEEALPTLLISECCLCYLEKDAAKNVIQYFSARLHALGIIIYEPTNIGDTFGQMMLSNFGARNLKMPSVEAFPSPEAQRHRLIDLGFSDITDSGNIAWLWDNWVSQEEKDRLSRIEMLDEVEEWEMLGQHYMISWGCREFGMASGVFRRWLEECRGVYAPVPQSPPRTPVGPRNVWTELGLNN